MKKYVFALILILLSLSLFACGGGGGDEPCVECFDTDGDGRCDACGEEMPKAEIGDVLLIEEGESKFQIVIAKTAGSKVRSQVNAKLAGILRNRYDVDVTVMVEDSDNDSPAEVEVLIGDVKNRGDEYLYDVHTLGHKGYIMNIVGNKIVINGGSDDAIVEALEIFGNDILGFSDGEVFNATMTAADVLYAPQTDYRVTSLSVNGTDLRGGVIATHISDDNYKESAEWLRDLIYTQTGYYMPIVDVEEADGKAIIIKKQDKVYGEDSFKAYPSGDSLIVECAFDNMLSTACSAYFNAEITSAVGAVDFTDTYKKDVSVVYYEDFGAKGDGITDDFRAIWDTHAFANQSGQMVKADPNATYYIFNTVFPKPGSTGSSRNSATIRTNVDWCGASFIIDDRWLGARAGEQYNNMCGGYIFNLAPDTEHAVTKITDRETLDRLEREGINRDTERINLKLDGWDGDLFLVVYNTQHKVFRRYGYPIYSGGDMHEIIIIDKDGYVSEETPIVYDFSNIDYINVYKLDSSSAITVENGNFTTRVAQANTVILNPDTNKYTTEGASGVTRGISVTRAYSTVRNITHVVTDEKPLSAQVDEDGNIIYCAQTYSGFYSASNTTDVLFEDCILSGRRCFKRPQGGTAGTYDISGNMVNNLYFVNCTQRNFWVTVDPETLEVEATDASDPNAISSMTPYTVNGQSLQMHWGISATNYCKNFYFVDSTLSRYDAHCGVYNGGIINTTVNYVEIIGNGTFIMDGMTYYSSGSNAVIPTRADYGWTWEGDVILTNVKAYVYTNKTVRLLYHGYNNWYYGYTCYFPNISVDNLDFYDITTGNPLPAGYRIELTNSVEQLSKMHLSDAHLPIIYSVEDKDGDGFIDEPQIDRNLDGKIDPPYDYDGDGNPYNTSYSYDNVCMLLGENIKRGYDDYGNFTNINITVPPSYIKIVGNDGVDGSGGYVYYVTDTSRKGISDGAYYREDSYDGFYGGTKFIFGEGEDDFIIGTDVGDRTDVKTFVFE